MSADKYLFIFSRQIEVTVYSGAFGGLILQVEFGYVFLIMIVNLIWRQMFLRKLRFATRYQYISIMLLQDDWLPRKWLYFIKIDPVQEFPGNNPPLYFYPFNNLVFRLNPCWAHDQEKIFLVFNLARSAPLFLRGDLKCKHVVIFIFRTEFLIR